MASESDNQCLCHRVISDVWAISSVLWIGEPAQGSFHFTMYTSQQPIRLCLPASSGGLIWGVVLGVHRKRERGADLTKTLQCLNNGIVMQVYNVHWRYQLMKLLR